MRTLFLVALSLVASRVSAQPASRPATDIPRFGIFDASLLTVKNYDNPPAQVSAQAQFTRPDGTTWRIGLFWDGGNLWRLRVSPDLVGQWSYRITSTDRELDGQQGTFRCVESRLHGALMPMKGFPHHFQYQDGTPVWLFGDTCWRLFCSNDEKKLNRDTVRHYIDVRASQGFNYIHADLFGYVAKPSAVNEGGSAFLDKEQAKINPAYFQEVDARLKYLNDKGITCGLIYAWGQGSVCWNTFADDAARLRYARYITSRYAAFNVVLIVSGEWQFMKTRKDLFKSLGEEIRKSDPHGRMIAIHPGPSIESNGDLAAEPWMSFGEYLQAYQVGGQKESTDADRHKLHQYVLGFRKNNKPVINGEYAYYLRDQNSDGKVDKPHSHTRESFRRASWMMPMAGAYFVTGFGTTYFGGHRDAGIFNVEAERNRPAESDLQNIRKFFTALECWRLSPADDQVKAQGEAGNPAYAYCLTDAKMTWVVHVTGASQATLDLSRSDLHANVTVQRYDPRDGRFGDRTVNPANTPLKLTPPDPQDWIFLVRAN